MSGAESLFTWVYGPGVTRGGSVVGHHQPEALRPVLFLFYTLETIFNMFCMGYHISGFQAIELHVFEWDTSVNICTGNTPAVVTEIWKSSAAAIVFILISLSTMWDAERQFYVFFFASELGDKNSHAFVEDRPIHPIFHYLRGMSISSLTCGILYLLHATIMIDVKLTNDRNQGESKGTYMPIPLFVLGRFIHRKLSAYDWFREFCENDIIYL
uniref:Uncharacterized protein, isoform B n=2 Tax=Drosophila melanogaster TaxID=7227 RepID=A0A0B4K806_DROME|nr:uncharacterized protein Dmel_CG34433, isoform B [Drosophila melanogaster]AFH06691.1 uncharacterized protein Dmel_CG34433, isoform B [Drosophila melanogaster]AOQ15472.1 CG34433-PB [synthetic construct]|eukprot:NP_001247374.1 uncharacterized protein Dmel_CG34433, isoform B [Drosophila melanogaster]